MMLIKNLPLLTILPASLAATPLEFGGSVGVEGIASRVGSETDSTLLTVMDLDATLPAGTLTFEVGLTGIWGHKTASLDRAGYAGVSNIAADDAIRFTRIAVTGESGNVGFWGGWLLYDDFFTTNELHDLLTNPSFGPVATLTENQPVSAWPLSSLGAVAEIGLTDQDVLRVGVFDGDAGDETRKSPLPDASFSSSQGALFAVEYTAERGVWTGGVGGSWHTGKEFTNFRTGNESSGLGTGYLRAQYDDPEGRWAIGGRYSQSFSPEKSEVRRAFDVVGMIADPFSVSENQTLVLGYLVTDLSSDFVQATRAGGDYLASAEHVFEVGYIFEDGPGGLTFQPGVQYSSNAVAEDSSAVSIYLRTSLDF